MFSCAGLLFCAVFLFITVSSRLWLWRFSFENSNAAELDQSQKCDPDSKLPGWSGDRTTSAKVGKQCTVLQQVGRLADSKFKPSIMFPSRYLRIIQWA